MPLHTLRSSFTEGDFWHRKVHQRLGEKLHFYLVRARPLDSAAIVRNLEAMTATGLFGSIHVFPLFGAYDVLIRIWLHPTNDEKFRAELSKAMVQAGDDRRVIGFTVDEITQSWYAHLKLNDEALRALNEETILRVQESKARKEFKELIKNGLVLKRKRSNHILFFVAINLRPEYDAEQAGEIADVVKTYVSHHRQIKNVSIYRGSGHPAVLIRAEVSSYFSIAAFGWIRQQFHHLGATTESYLVQTPGYVFADERIGHATFTALQGRDLLIQAILPEFYDSDPPPQRRSAIRKVFDDDIRSAILIDSDRNLLHDYLAARLHDDAPRMMTVLFEFFVGIEQFLRERHKEFIGRHAGGSIKEWYDRAELVVDSKKHLSLGDVLKVYQAVIKQRGPSEYNDLIGGWEDVANLRNLVAHGGVDILMQWEVILRRLLRQLPRFHRLRHLIEYYTSTKTSGV